MLNRIIRDEFGQAMTEYILVVALVALAFAASLEMWKSPLAKYLDRLVQTIAQTR